jgi:glutathione S-transferase
VIEDARVRAVAGFDVVERALEGRAFLLGDEFSGADVMMGFTLEAAKLLGLLDDAYPNVQGYLTRLESRAAFQRAAAD